MYYIGCLIYDDAQYHGERTQQTMQNCQLGQHVPLEKDLGAGGVTDLNKFCKKVLSKFAILIVHVWSRAYDSTKHWWL